MESQAQGITRSTESYFVSLQINVSMQVSTNPSPNCALMIISMACSWQNTEFSMTSYAGHASSYSYSSVLAASVHASTPQTRFPPQGLACRRHDDDNDNGPVNRRLETKRRRPPTTTNP